MTKEVQARSGPASLARSALVFIVLGPFLAGGFFVFSERLALVAWEVGLVPTAIAGLLFLPLSRWLERRLIRESDRDRPLVRWAVSAFAGAVGGMVGLLVCQTITTLLDPGFPSLFANGNLRLFTLMSGALCGMIVRLITAPRFKGDGKPQDER